MSPGFLENGIGYPGQWPYLPVMCVTAELEVDPGFFRLLQMGRLVVKEYRESLDRSGQFGQFLAHPIAAVVAADYVQSLEIGN